MAHLWLARPERIEALAHLCAFANEWPQRLEPHLRANVRPSLERLALRAEELALVRSPVLLLRGVRDRVCPAAVARSWAARLPDARLMPVADAGHLAWIDAPGVVQPALEQFLAGAWPLGSEVVSDPAAGAAGAGAGRADTAIHEAHSPAEEIDAPADETDR